MHMECVLYKLWLYLWFNERKKKKIKNILLIVNIYQESVKKIPNIPIPLTIETSCVFKHLFGHIRTPLHIYLLHLEAESGCEAGGFVMSIIYILVGEWLIKPH